VNGVRHIANVSDPQIPAALAPAVAGVVSMHDFMPHKMSRPKLNFTNQGSAYQAVVPADLAAIYDLNPLFAQGITGAGQTVAVIEDTNLYSSDDWSTFRTAFGLSQYSSGSLTTLHPNNCANPGVLAGDDDEAILDAEWASASAPGAAIVVAACADTRTTFGGFIAMQNLVNGSNPPSVMSISYGNCEAENGASSNAAISALYQQAVAEGISVFVSSGDEGAASCDAGATNATHGIGVSAYASTPYNVAVGGTDFSDSLDGTTANYWASTNSATYGSALSYIPEIPWNDSCAGSLLSNYLGYATVYGAGGFCSSTTAREDQLVDVVAGSGGPSNCATGSPSTQGVASGTCKGTAKPGWQAGLAGIPNDGVRDIPDVSLFAADGIWGHYYITCFSDVRNGGAACTGDPSTWAGAGGTSFASPILAGIQALVNQNMGGAQGNPNYVYYALAAANPSVFHSVTRGDIDVNCTGSEDCYGSSGNVGGGRGGRGGGGFGNATSGALSVSSSSLTPAYAAGGTWNFATGIGSVDAFNLVMNWSTGQ
jgi:subtilase family serine protease